MDNSASERAGRVAGAILGFILKMFVGAFFAYLGVAAAVNLAGKIW